jgi:hypothetical protein
MSEITVLDVRNYGHVHITYAPDASTSRNAQGEATSRMGYQGP